MSDRARAGLRGAVKSCNETSTYPALDSSANSSERSYQSTVTYDSQGRELTQGNVNSDGSRWLSRNEYGASGQLLKTVSGTEGQAQTETLNTYDQQGRLQKVTTTGREATPTVFHYDEHGRKTQVVTSLASDYRVGMASGGDPFESAQWPPNFPGGGTSSTIFDEYDRPVEVQVRDSKGTLTSHASRTYDSQGRVLEEKLTLDNFAPMVPSEAHEKILQESGLSPEQLQQMFHDQLSGLMGGQSESYVLTYRYDSDGRVIHKSRRIFNDREEVDLTYNQEGDLESETTLTTQPAGGNESALTEAITSFSETRYSYQYDQKRNWIEKSVSNRQGRDGELKVSTVTKRTLGYY